MPLVGQGLRITKGSNFAKLSRNDMQGELGGSVHRLYIRIPGEPFDQSKWNVAGVGTPVHAASLGIGLQLAPTIPNNASTNRLRLIVGRPHFVKDVRTRQFAVCPGLFLSHLHGMMGSSAVAGRLEFTTDRRSPLQRVGVCPFPFSWLVFSRIVPAMAASALPSPLLWSAEPLQITPRTDVFA